MLGLNFWIALTGVQDSVYNSPQSIHVLSPWLLGSYTVDFIDSY